MHRPQSLPSLGIDLLESSEAQIVVYFREHTDECYRILNYSYDKRFTPSTYFEEVDGGYGVGWFGENREEVIFHRSLHAAATDFVLFSLCRGRYQQDC